MIRNLSQVLLAVSDVDASAKFWEEKLGFVVVNRTTASETNEAVIEVGAHLNAETTLVLQKQNDVKQVAPTLVFNTMRFDEVYETLSETLTVGDVEEVNGIRTFTFKDLDQYVFRIKEAKELEFEQFIVKNVIEM